VDERAAGCVAVAVVICVLQRMKYVCSIGLSTSGAGSRDHKTRCLNCLLACLFVLRKTSNCVVLESTTSPRCIDRDARGPASAGTRPRALMRVAFVSVFAKVHCTDSG